MELSEAKEILKDMKESMEQSKKDITIDSILKALEDSVEAIDTVLKALEKFEKQLDLDYVDKNYISKDEIRKKMDNEEKLFFETKDARYANRRKILKELLGEE